MSQSGNGGPAEPAIVSPKRFRSIHRPRSDGTHDDPRHYGITELAEKEADIDMPRQVAQFMVQRIKDLDVDALCGVGCDDTNIE